MVTNHAGTDGNRRGPDGYRCCKHCNEDKVHDVNTDGHEIPCQTCDSPSDLMRERAEAAEAKVARVEALVARWIDDADQLSLTDLPPFDHTLNLCAKSSLYDCADDLRAALDGAE